MRNFKRGHLLAREPVAVPAQEVRTLLTDWAIVLRWWIKPGQGVRPGLNIAKSDTDGFPLGVRLS